MANIEKIDTDIALALKFFGIEPNEMDKAKDIKWLEKQNIIHQLNNDKRQLSNQYFAVLKQNQHRLDFVGKQLNNIQMINEKVDVTETKTNWFDNDYKEVQKRQDDDAELLAFKKSIEEAFMTVSIKDGEINSREGNFNQGSQQQFNNTQGPFTQTNQNRTRADGACLAGAWITLIFSILILIDSFGSWSLWGSGYYGAYGSMNIISMVLSIWTISECSKIINGTARSKTTAGVLGLIFGLFIGGLLILCGRYDEDK